MNDNEIYKASTAFWQTLRENPFLNFLARDDDEIWQESPYPNEQRWKVIFDRQLAEDKANFKQRFTEIKDAEREKMIDEILQKKAQKELLEEFNFAVPGAPGIGKSSNGATGGKQPDDPLMAALSL
jgi:hypothetical protein